MFVCAVMETLWHPGCDPESNDLVSVETPQMKERQLFFFLEAPLSFIASLGLTCFY